MSQCIHLGEKKGEAMICRDGPNGKIQRSFNINVCAIHKRCLPFLREWPNWENKPESKLFWRCHFCQEKETL